MTDATDAYPGGSKSRVNRAGEAVRAQAATPEDLVIIESWRAAHRAVLNTFQAILRTRLRGRDVIVAQRHKRKNTIFDKLRRLPGMQLARMDDVAGCRLIFKDTKELNRFRNEFREAKFNHSLRNDPSKYNYIDHPKQTGYRGIHDIYEYDVKSDAGRGLKGLYIEIQYRTLVQHAWATAVEVVGFITESQPKFERGDDRYRRAMAFASEILARAHEASTGPFPELSDRDVLKSFLELDDGLALMQTLRGLHEAKSDVSDKKNSILIFSPSGDLTVRSFRDATDALRELFDLEKRMPNSDIVLVRADTGEDVRTAFRNYFKDAREFVKLMDSACAKLSGHQRRLRRT
ncbi:RelA/SpoT domain-containing protein [Frateuria sp. GZRR35]|uniref:RelA/SpoT domain-containing protein n=1 Tax=Frateuria sp. GZRR35 TaxID=3351536 RepID=UPI003EDC41B5